MRARRGSRGARRLMAVAVMALAGCAGGPPPPDWQVQARAALDDAVAAYLAGDTRDEARAFERAREQIARTGRPDLLARVELMRCAARVASLVFEPCEGFERLRADAAAPERAYADHLRGRALSREDIERLPPEQRGVASAIANPSGAGARVAEIADPLSRLIGIALLFQSARADPQAITLAIDTASAQGWRRPLMAWLEVQALRAQRAGDVEEAQRMRRRIELVQRGGR